MGRHENDFRVDADTPLGLDELLARLAEGANGDDRSREGAIACYLSGSDGWRDAMKRLGGTFAGEAAGLKERKAD